MMAAPITTTAGTSIPTGEYLFNSSVPIFLKNVPSGTISSSIPIASTGSQFGASLPLNIMSSTTIPSDGPIRRLDGIQVEIFYSPTLEIRLTDTNDPFFYWQCSLSEEEFQHLRREQNLLVDFHRFAYKLIELFQQCLLHAREDLPQFSATLIINGSLEETSGGGRTAILHLNESTSFKQLVHLSLRLTAPSEPTFRKYLAEIFRRQRDELNYFKGGSSGGVGGMGIDLMRQPSMPAMPPPSSTFTTGGGGGGGGGIDPTSNPFDRIRWLETQNALLQQQKLNLERELNRSSPYPHHQYQSSPNTMETDIVKANEIIRRLQDEVKGLKSRARTAESSLRQLERVGKETGTSYEALRTELNEIRTTLAERNKRVEELETERNRLKVELEESKKLVEANEKVIEWLHQQLNEESISKILAGTGVPGTSGGTGSGTVYRYGNNGGDQTTQTRGSNNILPRLSPETWLGKSKLPTKPAGNDSSSSGTSPGIISPSASV